MSFNKFYPEHEAHIDTLYEEIKDAKFSSIVDVIMLLQRTCQILITNKIMKLNEDESQFGEVLISEAPALHGIKSAGLLLGLKP